MKYAIAGILIVDGAILLWTWRTGSGTDLAAMALALASITFFGSLPIALGVLSRRRADRSRGAARRDTVTIRRPQGPHP